MEAILPIKEQKVLNNGLVALMRVDGNEQWITRAARTSYRNNEKVTSEKNDANLLNYLMENQHTTPFEIGMGFVWYAIMPIFVARQWVRHRTASINEESLRYVEARNEFYLPEVDQFRMKPEANQSKQGRSSIVSPRAEEFQILTREMWQQCYMLYKEQIEAGIAPEVARNVLPLNTMTAWYWKTDLHNLFNFLRLRMDPHAQYEIRVYANAMAEVVREIAPISYDAWENSVLHSLRFNEEEQMVLRSIFNDIVFVTGTKPYQAKAEELGLSWSDRKAQVFLDKLMNLTNTSEI